MRIGVAKGLALACLAVVGLVLPAGCGGGGADGGVREEKLTDWPMFGRVPERTHYLPTERRVLDPPLRESWSINTHGLIEFPPAVARGVAYVANKFGNVRAVRLKDHRTIWEQIRDPKDSGKPTYVTAPTYHDGRVFLAFIDGELVALDAASGKPVWRRDLGSHLESSPLPVNGMVLIGSDDTNLIALRASDGKTRWQFNSPGAIKASPSYHDGRVYVADYEGSMYCLDADTGKVLWRTNTTKVRPFGDGGFYSSPAIAFGRVYAARDDGTVYAFDERPARSIGISPPATTSTGPPPWPRFPGHPPASTSAPTTSTSTRSTP
jgi:outer membrane protein assembly factor BamB